VWWVWKGREGEGYCTWMDRLGWNAGMCVFVHVEQIERTSFRGTVGHCYMIIMLETSRPHPRLPEHGSDAQLLLATLGGYSGFVSFIRLRYRRSYGVVTLMT